MEQLNLVKKMSQIRLLLILAYLYSHLFGVCIREIVTPFAVATETRRTSPTLVSIVKFHTLDSIKTWVCLHTLVCVGMCVCVYMCTCEYKQVT